MSSKDYDEMERIFCGTWEVDRGENLEEFMTAAGFPEPLQKVILMEKVINIRRDGNSFVEKATIGGVEFEMRTTLNEVQERKDKEVDPTYHIKTLPTYENGVWTQDITPQNANGGRRHIFKGHVEGDELIVDMTLPDVPIVTAKKFYKRPADQLVGIMSVQDYDEIEKLFCGTWKYTGGENWDVFMDAAEFSDGLRRAVQTDIMVTFKREGDYIKQETLMGNDLVYQINETREWKDREVDPQLHIKTHSTFKDGVFTQDVTPQTAGKRYIYRMSIRGDELISDLSLPDCPDVTAKRFYTKC